MGTLARCIPLELENVDAIRAVSIKMYIKLLIVPPALEIAGMEPDSIDISTASHSSQLQNYTTAKIAIMCAPSPRLTKNTTFVHRPGKVLCVVSRK